MPVIYSWPNQPYLEVSVRGTDSKIYDKMLNLYSNQWTGWTDMMHTGTDHPAFSRGTGSAGVLSIRGIDNRVYMDVV